MPSTYSPDLRVELIANGEQSGSWGATTNSNLGTIIEDAISGLASVSVTSANQALTALNGAADQARCAAIALTTTTTANFAVYVPPVTKLYVVINNSAYTATIFCSTVLGNTTAAGTGVAIPAGASVLLRADGANVTEQLNRVVGNFNVGGTVSVGGAVSVTGNTTLSNTLTVNSSVGTSGQVLLSRGAGLSPQWGAVFVSGMIMMWSGSIATIPSGWLLCDGSSGTPDLRDRFIIGARQDDAGVAKTNVTGSLTQTGGSKDAIVVSHTHTATVTDPGHFHNGPTADEFKYYGDSGIVANGPSGLRTTDTIGITQTKATGISVSNSTTGSSGTNANLPPYYALAFIMKV